MSDFQLQYLNPYIQIGEMLLPGQLYDFIPKKVEDWNERDVEKWFIANNIPTKSSFSFIREKFDGSAFINVTPEYLLDACGVSSRIIMKKIFEWLQYERQDFQEYVDQHSNMSSVEPQTKNQFQAKQEHQIQPQPTFRPSRSQDIIEIQYLPTQKDRNSPPKSIYYEVEKHSQSIMPLEVQKWKKKKIATQQSIEVQKIVSSRENSKKQSNKSENCIILGANLAQSTYQIIENSIAFKIGQKIQYLNNSGKIGRHMVSDIIVIGESVSRKHAQIIKDKEEFYIKDSESRFGTFVQVGTKNRKNIYEGDIIAFQDQEIQIVKYKFYKASNLFDLKYIKKGQKDYIVNLQTKKYVIIGKQKKDINIDQPSICDTHSRITCNSSGQLIIHQEEGKCFKKLKKNEIFKLDEKDDILRFGLAIIEINIIDKRKPISTISQFNNCQV